MDNLNLDLSDYFFHVYYYRRFGESSNLEIGDQLFVNFISKFNVLMYNPSNSKCTPLCARSCSKIGLYNP